MTPGTSPAVQQLRLCASTAGSTGLIHKLRSGMSCGVIKKMRLKESSQLVQVHIDGLWWFNQ